jgi:hypothetical protein
MFETRVKGAPAYVDRAITPLVAAVYIDVVGDYAKCQSPIGLITNSTAISDSHPRHRGR